MQSSLIGKVEKAKQYSNERERVEIADFTASFRGEHNSHEVTFHSNSWRCSCDFFNGHSTCSHTMAMERMLQGMLSTYELSGTAKGS